MYRKYLITGGILGLIAVILGAFAAHGLKESISENSLNSFETGVRFQMYHAFLLIILGNLNLKTGRNALYILFTLGIILFSGSIYLLSTTALSGINFTSIALITPLGGGLLIIGWFILVLNFIKLKKK